VRVTERIRAKRVRSIPYLYYNLKIEGLIIIRILLCIISSLSALVSFV